MDLRLVKYFDVLILWLLSVSSLATFFTPFISLTHALSLTLSHALSHTHLRSFPPFFVATSTHIFFHKKPRLPNISLTRQLADYIVCLLLCIHIEKNTSTLNASDIENANLALHIARFTSTAWCGLKWTKFG